MGRGCLRLSQGELLCWDKEPMDKRAAQIKGDSGCEGRKEAGRSNKGDGEGKKDRKIVGYNT